MAIHLCHFSPINHYSWGLSINTWRIQLCTTWSWRGRTSDQLSCLCLRGPYTTAIRIYMDRNPIRNLRTHDTMIRSKPSLPVSKSHIMQVCCRMTLLTELIREDHNKPRISYLVLVIQCFRVISWLPEQVGCLRWCLIQHIYRRYTPPFLTT
jgi:hypothetical protein